MRGGKGLGNETDESYKRLYAAIYRQAVADDIREVKKKVRELLKSEGVNRSRILEYLGDMEPEIKAMVCDAVYEEAQNFVGGRTRKMQAVAIAKIVDRMMEDFYGR